MWLVSSSSGSDLAREIAERIAASHHDDHPDAVRALENVAAYELRGLVADLHAAHAANAESRALVERVLLERERLLLERDELKADRDEWFMLVGEQADVAAIVNHNARVASAVRVRMLLHTVERLTAERDKAIEDRDKAIAIAETLAEQYGELTAELDAERDRSSAMAEMLAEKGNT